MSARLTPTAWGTGARNVLVSGLGFLAFCSVIAASITVIYRQSLSDSLDFAVKIAWGLALLAFFGTWLYDRANAGHVLLDCGRQPTLNLMLFCAGLSLILALMNGRPIFNISFAALSLIVATGRLQVRENGIWLYASLLRWHRIGSYCWADDATLIVKRRGPFGFFSGALSVPPEHRKAIEGFLSECRGLQDPTDG